MSTREQVVRVAEKYVAKGKIDAAIKEYLKVLKENPSDVNTLNRLGDLYARISRIDDAVRLFTQIAEQYTEDGFLVKAIAIYKKIIKLDPTRLQVYENLAGLYHKQGLVNEARTQYQVLGDYYLKHNDAAAAINIYQKMAELEPDNPSHHLKLAELYQQGQLWDKALRSYRTIAELMLQHDRVEEAMRVYQRAIEVHSQDVGFITDAVLGLKDAGHQGAAARLLAIAVAANPEAERIARLAGLRQATAVPEVEADDRATMPPPAPEPEALPWAEPEAAVAPEPAERPVVAPPPPPEEEDVFVLDMDDDAPASQVAPPADMVEPGSAFQRPPAPAPAPATPRLPPAEEADAGFEFDLPELEVPDLTAPSAATDSAAAGPELELDDFAELELPPLEEDLAPAADAAAGQALPWQEQPPPPALPETGEMEVDLSELGLEGPAVDEQPLPAWAVEPAAAAAPAAADPGQLDAGFELELEPVELEAAEPDSPAATAAAEAPAAVPPPAAEPPRVQDLLAEAEVFAKYGLEEKARERLDQVLAAEPDHLEALQLLLDLQLKAGDGARVDPTVRRLREAVDRRGAAEVWEKVRQKLARAGIQVDGGPPAVAPRAESEQRVSQLLKSLVEEPAAAPQPPRPSTPKKRSIDDALAELTSGLRTPSRTARPAAPPAAPAAPKAAPAAAAPAAVPPSAAPPAPPAAAAGPPPAVLSGPPPAAAAPPPAAPPPVLAPPPAADEFEDELPDIVLPEEQKPQPDLDDSSMDWLREAPAAPAAAAPGEKLFDEEDEFFNLAAELEEELGAEEGRLRGEIVQAEEPSLEEIVEGFKKGVAENLSAEDYDTHYNLGIAYREMGLLDEAIGEFQLAAKDPAHLVDCCSMLGVSFLEKGLPELAVKWYQRGLTAPDLKEEVMLSLLYDMGNVYMAMGDEAAARKTFVELYGINSHYRDVVAKLEELGR